MFIIKKNITHAFTCNPKKTGILFPYQIQEYVVVGMALIGCVGFLTLYVPLFVVDGGEVGIGIFGGIVDDGEVEFVGYGEGLAIDIGSADDEYFVFVLAEVEGFLQGAYPFGSFLILGHFVGKGEDDVAATG